MANTRIASKWYTPIQKERKAGAAGILAGMLVQFDASGEVVVHANAGETAMKSFTLEDELQGKEQPPLFKRPRPLIYMSIMFLAAMGIIYGLTHLGSLELHVLHERQPLFVLQSDGSIQNRYEFKVLNKTHDDMKIGVSAKGHKSLVLVGSDKKLVATPGRISSFTLFVRIPKKELSAEREPITFTIHSVDDDKITAVYESMFFGPRVR